MRSRPLLRVLLSLCVGGLLVGLMIGRLLNPPVELPKVLGIEVAADGLVVELDGLPVVRAGHLEGVLALQIDASGEAQQGQLRIADAPVRWKLEPQGKGLLLTLLSTRRLQGTWDSAEVEGQWRLNVRARPEATAE